MATNKDSNNYGACTISGACSKNSGANNNGQPEGVAADFETAIAATKFGKFNIFLYLLAIPAAWSNMFETTTMSYVFPAAQCDLNLTLNEKGSLNAITFLGMITSGFIWGFLCDTLGRKKLMVFGYLLDSLLVLISSLSQNLTVLLVTKFLGGFIVNGPFAALTAYLSEFHCAKHRTRVQMARGMIISFGTMTLPLLAWAILPQPIDFQLFGYFTFHSWNVFLMVCALPSLISGIVFIFMPESPKFLMTTGRNAEALNVFKRVYSLNTGLPAQTFPISALVEETMMDKNWDKHGGHVTANRTKAQALREGFQQIKPLCFPPHLKHIVLICTIQCLYMLSHNTLRLWSPQIFQSISDYQYSHNGTTADLCTMLSVITQKPAEDAPSCFIHLTPSVYLNTMILSVVSVVGFIIAASIINKTGKKSMIVVSSIIAATCGMSIFWAQDTATTLALQSLSLALGGISGNVIVSITIDLFPTSLRAVALSLVMMLARSSSMVGNFIFPFLLQMGCAPPFFSIGGFIYVCCILSLFLPNTDLKDLE